MLALVFVALVRRGVRELSIRDAIRRFNRRWFNPFVLRFAGNGPWPIARLEHRGRRSGLVRSTPVLAWPAADGFIVPMPYGTDVDWAKNLLHAGEGVLQHQGARFLVDSPRIGSVAADAGRMAPLVRAVARGSWLRHVMLVDVHPHPTPGERRSV